MEKYYCKYCKYTTTALNNFKSHLQTQKHTKTCNLCGVSDANLSIKKCKIMFYECEFCCESFPNRMKRWRHMEKCVADKHIENTTNTTNTTNTINTANIVGTTNIGISENAVVNELIKKNELMEKQIAHQNEQIAKQIENQSELLKNVIMMAEKNAEAVIESAKATTESAKATTESAKATKKSVSMLKYANTNLMSGKPLEKLEHKKAYELIGYEGPINKISSQEYEKHVEMCISKYRNGAFINYVGDMIIERYKEEKKEKTNIITTDVSRLSLLVLQKVDKTINSNEKEWINDKSGKRFISLILRPLLEVLKKSIVQYIDLNLPDDDIHDSNKKERQLSIMTDCLKIKRDIENDKFIVPILKYVAPSFHFDSYGIKDTKEKHLEYNKYDDRCIVSFVESSESEEEVSRKINTNKKIKR